ncbi:MAG TPA: GNAT family N-acetyltransferase [Solirubrobacterales bacterium]|nr:GNAT family N-acetyltransferase [Solirubrobacterales bacterium]
MSTDAAIEVADNPADGRFEITVDDQLAGFVVYRDQGGTRELVHTEIDPSFEGQGLGGRLAAGVFELLRERGEEIIPVCPFITSYIRKHPEYADVVVPAMRRRFG